MAVIGGGAWVPGGGPGSGAVVFFAFSEAPSNLFSSSCTMTALAGIGGIPPIESPGGGLAGETEVPVVVVAVDSVGGSLLTTC